MHSVHLIALVHLSDVYDKGWQKEKDSSAAIDSLSKLFPWIEVISRVER